MRYRKGVTALLLCFLTGFIFSGCGAVPKNETAANQNIEETVTETSAEQMTDEFPVSSAEPSSDASGYKPGRIKKNKYTNTVLGIRFKGNDEWSLSTAKEIREQNGAGKKLTDEEYLEYLSKLGSWYEMFARCSNGDTVNIVVEHNETLPEILEHRDLESIVSSQKKSVIKALKKAGATDVTFAIVNKKFPIERDYVCTKSTMTISDIDVTQYQITTAADDYFYTITVTCMWEDHFKDIRKLFSSI